MQHAVSSNLAHRAARRGGLRAALALTAGLCLATAGGRQAAPAPGLPSLEEQLSVREVELVLEPPLGKGWRDLRPQLPDPNFPGYMRFTPPLPQNMGNLSPADLLVLEDGRARPVLRLEPLAPAARLWSLRIYFDLVLARPDTVFEAAIALAYDAHRLVELGAVEIVVADPEPRTVLAPSRDTPAIKEALAALAGQSRRDPRARLFAPFPPPPPAIVRRQCDRLITSLADTVTTGPHALLLVAEPPPLSAAELHVLAAGSTTVPGHPAPSRNPAMAPAAATPAGTDGRAGAAVPGAGPPLPAGGPAETLGETARLLAAYGWMTLALPIHRLTGNREPAPEDDFSRFAREQWQDPHIPGGINFVPLLSVLIQTLRGKKPALAPDKRLLAPRLGMDDAALAALVRPTAGLVVPYRDSLAPALGVLAARWHLWYQADASLAGRERAVAVSLLANGLEVRTTRWVRSSIPEAVAAARLRRNLDGDSLPGPLPISVQMIAAPGPKQTSGPVKGEPGASAGESGATPRETGGPGASSLDASRAPEARILLAQAGPARRGSSPSKEGGAAAGPLRVSFAWQDAQGHVRVTHQRLAAAAADSWNRRHVLELAAPQPLPGQRALGVLIEDLASELWGCAVVTVPEAGGPPTETPHPGA